MLIDLETFGRHVGMTYIRVEVSRGLKGRRTPLRLLVDTGSFFTMLPSALLDEMGIQREWKEEFEVANGESMIRDVGRVHVRHESRWAETFVIFGEARDSNLLGAYALEGLGLEVDSRTKKVRPRRKTLLVAVTPG